MPPKKLFLASTLVIVLISLPLIGSVCTSSQLWSQSYGGAEYDSAYSLVETSDRGFALAGVSNSFGGFWLVKTDAIGNMMWNRAFGGSDYDQAESVVQTSDGGYALVGYTRSFGFGAGQGDFWLVKTDANGNMEWNQT